MAEADPNRSSSQLSATLDRYRVLGLDQSVISPYVGFDGKDVRSRPFKLLRTQLAKVLDERETSLIGITSPAPAAGKSFLSLNIAASLAQLRERAVYLVDLDLRRASIAGQLDLAVDKGVDAFLRGEALSLADIGLRLDGYPLVVFPTNQVTSGSEEYVAGAEFERFIQLLRAESKNAIMLFDLPPVFASDDAMISIESLDGYIMVVDSGRTNRRQITEAVDMLRPSPLLGTVLNRYKGGLLDSYGYYSHTYDHYYGT
jgi:Mrp family chromosome partitioning ATPase